MNINTDEEVPVRSFQDYGSLREDTKFNKDDEQEPTLRRVYQSLKADVEGLDKWHAFDLTESELKLKQQIKAHQIAYNILAPVLETIEQALATVDEKFRQELNERTQ